jgi:uroporphyrinogen decarboxylase
MGLGLYFEAGEGPKFKNPLTNLDDIEKLEVVRPETELSYVMDAVRLIRRELGGKVPLIGFSGSPWTLATYMVEGGSSKDYRRTKTLIYNHPELAHQLLDKLADSVIAYLNAQIEAGAQAVQIFDSWGGALSYNAYQEFSLAPMAKIVAGLHKQYDGRKVPVILFTKGGGQWLELMGDTGADCLGLDWTTDLGYARQRVGDKVALQGNMDPAVLYAKPARIREEVANILSRFGHGSGHIFNLGHGITPEVDPEHAGAFFDAVVELSPKYHS